MTEDEAITMFMKTIGNHVPESDSGVLVSAVELAVFVRSDNDREDVRAFVDAFSGSCGCGASECMTKLVDAVEKCMKRCEALYSPSKHAPTTRAVQ